MGAAEGSSADGGPKKLKAAINEDPAGAVNGVCEQ